MTEKPKTISISAKCSDLFWAQLRDAKGAPMGEYTGYVPDFFPGEHWGDYVQLDIDIVSGHIVNWRKPTMKNLKIFKDE